MGIQHLLMINSYKLDKHNFQLRKVVHSRDLELNHIISVIKFIGSLNSLRNQTWKTVCWFCMRSSNNIIVEVGHYNSPSNSHFPVRHQLRRSIVKFFCFYPGMAQDVQSGFFQRKQRQQFGSSISNIGIKLHLKGSDTDIRIQ